GRLTASARAAAVNNLDCVLFLIPASFHFEPLVSADRTHAVRTRRVLLRTGLKRAELTEPRLQSKCGKNMKRGQNPARRRFAWYKQAIPSKDPLRAAMAMLQVVRALPNNIEQIAGAV